MVTRSGNDLQAENLTAGIGEHEEVMLILLRTMTWSSALNLCLAVSPEGRKKISSPLRRFGLMAGSFRKDAVS